MKLIKRILGRILRECRKLRCKIARRRLQNTTPTIVANDCVGGVIYHDLGLQFRSPTVNLWIPTEEFLLFAKDMQAYLSAELTQVPAGDKPYPVGALEYGGNTVTIHFMHYPDFPTAARKWEARKQRMDMSNLYLILDAPDATAAVIEAFEALPYGNKLLISASNPTHSPLVQVLPLYASGTYQPGEILQHPSRFAMKRHLDDVDYISFLNRS